MSYILIYLASLRQGIKTKVILILLLLIYTISGITEQTDWTFNIINMFLLVGVTLFMQLFKKGNIFISVFSILIYSVLIDIVCYFLYPQFVYGVSLFDYILNGIAFNYKGLIIASVVCLGIGLCIHLRGVKNESKINFSR